MNKKSIGIIIGIVVVVAAIILVGVFMTKQETPDAQNPNTQTTSSKTPETNETTENTPSEKPTENEEKNPSQAAFPYTLIVYGQEYTFPMRYDEIVERGWVSYCAAKGKETMDDFAERTIKAGGSGIPFMGGCGGMNLQDIIDASVIFDNTDGTQDRKVRDCPVIGIKFENEDRPLPVGVISVKGPNGIITVGESTSEDVVKFLDGQYSYMEDDGFITGQYDDNDVLENLVFTLK